MRFTTPNFLRWVSFWTASVLVGSMAVGNPAFAQGSTRAPNASHEFVENKLRRERFSEAFIKDVLKSYEEKDFNQVIELNVLLYLRKSNYHGTQVTEDASKAVDQFQTKYSKSLQRAEKRYGVPSAVVASLLWIESRHGQNVGRFHVPSVYLHLIQAPRKVVQNHLLSRTDQYAATTTPEDHREIVRRTRVKAAWALSELRAIEKIHSLNWKIGSEFRGSFSGAFGMPQFLPSSYVRWAKSVTPKAQPNLTKSPDAILSVAHYLREHGWSSDSTTAGFNALMKYNNSRDYANAILHLSGRSGVDEQEKIDAPSATSASTREPSNDSK